MTSTQALMNPGEGRAERRFRLLAELIPQVVWIAEPDGRAVYLNPRWAEYTGQRAGAALGFGWLDAVHPEDRERCRALHGAPGERDGDGNGDGDGEAEPVEAEIRLRRHDGAYRWVLCRAQALKDDDGRTVQWFGAATDIDDQKQQAARFRTSIERLLDCFAVLSAVRDRAGRLVDFRVDYLNDSACLSRRLSREEQLGRPLGEVWPEFHRAGLLGPLARVVAEGEPLVETRTLEVADRAGNTVSHPVELRASKLNDGLVLAWRDVPGRPDVSEGSLLRRMLDQLFAFVGVMTPDGTLVEANRAPLEAAGLEPADVLGKKFWDCSWWNHDPAVRARVKAACERAAAGEASRYDVEVRMAGDRLMPIDFQVAPLRDDAGRVVYLIPSASDLTERKRIERDLRDSEDRLRLAMEVGRAFAFEWDPETDTILRSENCGTILGLTGDATRDAGLAFFGRIHPEDRERFTATVAALAPGNDAYHASYRVRRDDGAYAVLEESARAFFDPSGRLARLVGMTADITERERAVETLREREAVARRQLVELDATYATAPIGLCVLDSDLRWVRINAALAEINGFPIEAHLGRRVRDLLPTIADQADAMLERVRETGQPVRNIEVSGQTPAQPGVDRTWVEHFYPLWDPDGRFLGVNVVCEETTARKHAEAALRQSEGRFRGIVENAAVGIVEAAPDGRFLVVNDLFCRMVGHAREDLLARTVADISHPDDWPADAAEIAKVRAGSSDGYTIDKRFVRPDGSAVWTHLAVSAVRDAAGTLVSAVAIVEDITERREAERALAETQSRLRAFVDANVIGILFGDVHGGIYEANDEFLRIVGRTREDLAAGRVDWVAITPPGDLPLDDAGLAEARATGRCTPYLKHYLRPDGTRVPVMIGYVLGGERREKSVAFILDLSAQKRAEAALHDANRRKDELLAELRESESQFRSLADSIPQLAWMAGPDGALFWYNRRWYEYTGTTPEEMVGWGWQEVHDPAELPRVLATYRDAIARGEPWEDTFPLRRHDGQMRWHLSRAVPLRDESGRIVRWFGTNTDITQRREMEDALREADRRKNVFLAVLSHELRNPLSAIRNALRLADNEATADERAWVREVVDRQSRHLALLIDDLLDLTRINEGKFQLRRERLALGVVLDRAVDSARPLIEQHAHALRVEVPPGPIHLDADPTRLEQIVVNLLTNAAKYTPRGGSIRLEARVEGGSAVVAVTDNGVGIPPEMLPRIFEMFAQVDVSLDRSQGGLGIGLSLVRNLVEMHGGTIVATSPGADRGSTFTVRLPLAAEVEAEAKPAPAAPAPVAPSPPSAAPLRVLVVDDNVDAVRALSRLLARRGHDVRVAHDGPTALGLAATHRPEAVLLDIGLPGMSGLEVARRLRGMEATHRATLIAVSGFGQEQDLRNSKAAGIDEHLVKPVDVEAVLRLLARIGRRDGGPPAR
jgi:PAS domain S-box-containing protein